MARERKFTTKEIFTLTKQLLLKVGYEGFTISLLAESMAVSRAAIYKYYTNKEELIMDFMLEEMNEIVEEIGRIDSEATFIEQLDQLIHKIFQYKDLHQMLGAASQIDSRGMNTIIKKKEKLEQLHFGMYRPLQGIIERGKKEGFLVDSLSNEMIIGFIFQTIDIPNHTGVPADTFMQAVKQMILHGISNKQ
ncbi:TetR/AcrR family transcriptional regulator [Ectobacillus sp. sgz5001026]|uniref:TetR/AcrR family transcriptional regulator n=1 Tax=Ectobacillus sp. sgz5001026 TaxID=3242473 RepID=UPI0036D31820